jgi:hypothetical protein
MGCVLMIQKRMHGALTLTWLAFAPIAVLTNLKNSIPLLVFISVYANVAGHWAAYEAAKADEYQRANLT